MGELRKDWHNERQKGLGGSDAPVVCGVSPWKTPYALYKEKRGEIEAGGIPEENEPMRWGTLLEPVIRQRYSDVTGRQVLVPNTILKHPDIPFMLANVDGIADGGRVLEVKTSRSPQGWGEPGSSDIPDPYVLQICHYMIVTHLPVADVAVLIGGNDFRIYEVPEDRELQEMLIEREREFWRMVQDGIPPEPTTFSDIRQKYGKISKAYKIQATDVVIAALARLKELRTMAEEEEAMKALIMGYMRDNDTLVDGEKILATWKSSNPQKRFDTKAFQIAHPDLYQQFLKEGEASRRFLVK